MSTKLTFHAVFKFHGEIEGNVIEEVRFRISDRNNIRDAQELAWKMLTALSGELEYDVESLTIEVRS